MQAKWVKPVTRTSVPRTLVTLAYDPWDGPGSGHGFETKAASWSLLTYRRRGKTWAKVRESSGCGVDATWVAETLTALGESSSRIYVISPVASDSLTLLGFWRRVDSGRVEMRLRDICYTCSDGKRKKRRPHPLILNGQPDVIGWSEGGAEYRAISYGNHLSIPLVEAARMVGHEPCPEARTAMRPTGHAFPDSAWTVSALQAVYQRLMGWWVENGAGRWQDTIGAAAYQWWRTTVGPKTVLEHTHPAATKIEESAIHGGRVQLFWFGSAGAETPSPETLAASPRAVDVHMSKPVYKLDVRSMYVSILAKAPFPTRLIARLRCRTPPELAAACRSIGVVATVRVRLSAPRLPFRCPERGTVYPTGEWWTTLTTPELETALQRSEVVSVAEVWAYQMGRPFQSFAEALTRIRTGAIAGGDTLGGTFTKLMGNALGGRLAKTGKGWVTESHKPCRRRWGPWGESNLDEGARTICRGVAGVRQRYVNKGIRPGGLAACFAFLTAYGRVLLNSYIDVAGERETLWVDTDGLVVTQEGYDRLLAAGLVRGDAPGYLRREEAISHFAARTPKHYVQGDAWTLSGVRDDYGPVRDGVVRCYQSANPVRSGVRPLSDSIPTRTQTLKLDQIPLSGTPGIDGWLIPPEVRDGQLFQRSDRTDPDEPEWG